MLKSLNLLLALCLLPFGTIASGPAVAGNEIKVIEHASTDAVTDTGAAGDSAGDILTFANDVFDADDKNKIGTDQGSASALRQARPGNVSGPSLWRRVKSRSRARSMTPATPCFRSLAVPPNMPTREARWR
jgi:hypothetical protein